MPSLSKAVFFSITAAVAFVMASDYAPKFPLWFRFILVAIGVITTGGAIVEGINWLAYVTALRVEEIRRLATITPVMEAMRIMGKLSAQAQIELAMHFNNLGVDYRAWVSEAYAPSFFYATGGHNIPWYFISEFFALSTDRYLPAVRQWPSDSKEHLWADALTADLVQRHYAMTARGNKPAAWIFEGQGRVSMRARAEKVFDVRERVVLDFEDEEQ